MDDHATQSTHAGLGVGAPSAAVDVLNRPEPRLALAAGGAFEGVVAGGVVASRHSTSIAGRPSAP